MLILLIIVIIVCVVVFIGACAWARWEAKDARRRQERLDDVQVWNEIIMSKRSWFDS